MNCAVLLASLFPGVQIADLDRSTVYQVPAAFANSVSWTTRQAARRALIGTAFAGVSCKDVEPKQACSSSRDIFELPERVAEIDSAP